MIELADITIYHLLPFIAVGFAAQMVDGALGMAFGVISQTLLVSVLGVPPAAASASVHVVEMFTTSCCHSGEAKRSPAALMPFLLLFESALTSMAEAAPAAGPAMTPPTAVAPPMVA